MAPFAALSHPRGRSRTALLDMTQMMAVSWADPDQEKVTLCSEAGKRYTKYLLEAQGR